MKIKERNKAVVGNPERESFTGFFRTWKVFWVKCATSHEALFSEAYCILFILNSCIVSGQSLSDLIGKHAISRKSRREQVVISRLRTGHTRLTHSFILKQEPQPQCLTCQTTCTVKHILIECRAFTVIRKQFFKVNSLIDLFEYVKIDDVLSFLRETGLYEKTWRIKTG